ncbi:MAG: thioredoxin-disulfide reductase [Candidatus Fimenecus sp.]
MEHIYDVIIIGGGPAGYTAAIYASRSGLDTVVLEKLSAGGQMALTTQIENYPGFPDGIDGFTLGEYMQKSAERFGAKTVIAEVFQLFLKDKIKKAETSEGSFLGKTVVFAAGADPRPLGLPNEKILIGKGINYCAACDGMAFKNKDVAVVGGGNTAVEDALLLSRICRKVVLIHRRDSLRATKVYSDKLLSTENIEVVWNSTVKELLAGERLNGIKLLNLKTGEESELTVDGVFVSIGRLPLTELVKDELELDSMGYIQANESTKTNIDGVFAVGDVRTKILRQVITAAADGAVAVHYIEEYLAENK